MKAFSSSIRRQLLAWLLVPIMSLWFVSAAITYWLGSDFANNAHDDALLDSAKTVQSRLSFSGSQPSIDLPQAAVAIFRHSEKDKLYYQVLAANGSLISGDVSVPLPRLWQLTDEPDFAMPK